MPRALRILLKVLLGVIFLIVVLIGAILVRIAVKPLSVDFLIPRLEGLAEDSPTGLTVRLETASLVWDVEDKQIEVAAEGFRLIRPGGETLVELPVIQVSVSVSALLNGVVAPTTVEVRQGQIHVVRDTDGTVLLGKRPTPLEPEADQDSLAAPKTGVLDYMTDNLVSTPDPTRPLSYLRKIELGFEVISIDDRAAGESWSVKDWDLTVQRADTTLTGNVRFDIPSHGQLARFDARVGYENEERQIQLDASIKDLWLSSIASAIPYVNRLDADFPIEGKLGIEFDTHVWNTRVDLEVSGDPAVPGGQGVGVSVKGTIAADSVVTANADLRLDAMDMSRLGTSWPADLVPDVRSWVLTNIPRGTVNEVSSHVQLRWPRGQPEETTIDSLRCTVDFEGLEVDYVDIFPPALSVQGTGAFESGGLSFHVTGATAGHLTIRDTDVRISELLSKDPRLTVDFHAVGEVAEALRIVNEAGVVPLKELGFEAGQFGGGVDAHCRVKLPINDPDDLDLTVSASLADLSVTDVIPGCDVADGSLDLVLDLGSFRLQGRTRFADTPVELHWHETYSDTARIVRAVRGRATPLDDSTLSRLGVDLTSYYAGGADLEFDLTTWRDGRSHLEATATLDRSSLAIPFLGWSKDPGVPGIAGAVVSLVDYRPVTIDTLHVSAGTLTTQGSGYLKRDGKDDIGFDLHAVALGETNLEAVTLAREESVWRIELTGGEIDAEPMLNAAAENRPTLVLQDSTEVGAPDTLSAPPPVPDLTLPSVSPADSLAVDPDMVADVTADTSGAATHAPFTLKATDITRVSFQGDREARNVEIDIRRSPTMWTLIDIQAETDPAPPWEQSAERDTTPTITRSAMYYGPGPSGVDTLWIDVSDLGSLLHGLHLHDGFRGGVLKLRGHHRGARPAPIDLHFEVEDLVAINVPALARILNHASVEGLMEPYQGDAIRLSETRSNLTYGADVFTVTALTSESASFGLTGEGTIDLDGETIDWEGALVPIKGLNTFLGKIPIIGNIFHKGDGLLAMDYTLAGSFDDIAVKVKPLSIITPAFLKDLFRGSGDASDQSANGSR